MSCNSVSEHRFHVSGHMSGVYGPISKGVVALRPELVTVCGWGDRKRLRQCFPDCEHAKYQAELTSKIGCIDVSVS